MSSQPKPYLTPEQYLALERTAAYKSEYFRGEVFAMAGASPTHVLMVSNIVAALHGKEIWEGIDAQEYVNQLRSEWDEHP